ncbi:protein translocase subunit SecD [Aeoliella sp.]|uniref:protein translocase subunit SecD n=1 Tax=Aeoliella sp. TaxID=2795800 RepID=UPI003CCBC2CA
MNQVINLRSWTALLIVFSLLAIGATLTPSVCLAQDAGSATAEQPAEEVASEEAASANETASADEGATEDVVTEETTEEVVVDDDATEEAPADGPAEEGTSESGADSETADAETSEGMSPFLMAAIILALFIVPGFIGASLAKSLNMPDHGWKIATVLGIAAAGILAVVSASTRENGFKLGPDLGGGVTLIYDLADPKLIDEEGNPQDPEAESEAGTGRRDSFSMDEMLAALKERVDPSGTKEVTIRSRGKSIEIIIPKAGQAELEDIKRKITDLGQLEFRILADRTRNEFKDEIELALRLPPGQTVAKINNIPVARWVEYDIDEFGKLDEPPKPDDIRGESVVKRMGVHAPEILVHVDPYNVTGEYLDGASKDVGPEGFQVQFRFNTQGSNRFGKLTGKYIPNPRPYFLGIILDEQLRSAPSIRSRITSVGTISGRGMDEEEVEHVVSILDAGSLPAALNKTPVSETLTGPEIGELTIKQGTRAMIVSMSIVLAFILIYYRFAGIVACLALVLNIVLVVGAMVLLNAAFTLPGLAGLVLTVGMSVDANVLIFERIREELARGATLRMAIRNGFGRATTTIVDANVTTLITGLVLYVIGTDQIKGFAITLILGIIMSMYTAIFCSRLLFDIAERRGWITKLTMMHIFSRPDFHFMSKWPVATLMSLVVIGAGMFGVAGRKSNLLNIDFTGGTSVTMVLQEAHAMTQGEVKEALEEPLKGKNLLVVERKQDGPEGTTFKVDCSVLDDVDEKTGETIPNAVEHVEDILKKTFEGKLETYEISATPLEAFAEGEEGENQFSGFESKLHFGEESEKESLAGVSYDTLMSDVRDVLADMDLSGVAPVITNPKYTEGSSRRYAEWTVRLAGVDQSQAQAVIDTIVDEKNGEPIFPLANKIGGRVAGDMRLQAIYAIGVSLLGIIGYIWIRFQKISYGLAAVVALVHDVLVTLGIIALSAYLVEYAGGIAGPLQIDAFQISLPIVAAFLTIIGYSLNDTIVVFDRIREVRGKSPTLTAEMINTSVNQTLSRTLLTSLTTLIVVAILYFFGGDGIHAFAFALVIGVIVGTYSSIFIASPVLLWLSNKEQNWSV